MADHADTPESIKKKRIKIGIAAGCIVAAIAVFFLTSTSTPSFRTDLKYYSDDDGKTWYTDSTNNIPPYQHNGKTAHAAVIFSYAGGSKQFCGYLVRFPENVKSQIEKEAVEGAKRTPPVTAASLAWGTEISQRMEVKAPSSPGPWVGIRSNEAAKTLDVKSPDGSELDQVLP